MAEYIFDHLDADGWFEILPAFQTTMIHELLRTGKTEEEVAEIWLSQIGSNGSIGFGSSAEHKSYFTNFRNEIDAFLCGDERYSRQRAEASTIWEKQGKISFVAVVAGFLATEVGVSAVSLIPVISLLFSFIGKAGVGAYCKTRGFQ